MSAQSPTWRVPTQGLERSRLLINGLQPQSFESQGQISKSKFPATISSVQHCGLILEIQVLASGDQSGLLTIWSLDEQDGEGALVPQVQHHHHSLNAIGRCASVSCVRIKKVEQVLIFFYS